MLRAARPRGLARCFRFFRKKSRLRLTAVLVSAHIRSLAATGMPVARVGGVRAARRTPTGPTRREKLRADAVAEGAPERITDARPNSRRVCTS